MLLKLKNYKVATKGRGCAYGWKQRNWMSKQDTTFSIVSNEGFKISCMIDMMEGRDVVTADIPGAFLHTYYDKGEIHINMQGSIVTLLEEIDTA